MPYTNQEFYNKVAAHLLSQGRPALDETNECCYRNTAGLKCAIGAIIPDNIYSPDFEGLSIDSLCLKHSSVRKLLANIDIMLAIDLQAAHDNFLLLTRTGNYHKTKLKTLLKQIAAQHDLEPFPC